MEKQTLEVVTVHPEDAIEVLVRSTSSDFPLPSEFFSTPEGWTKMGERAAEFFYNNAPSSWLLGLVVGLNVLEDGMITQSFSQIRNSEKSLAENKRMTKKVRTMMLD